MYEKYANFTKFIQDRDQFQIWDILGFFIFTIWELKKIKDEEIKFSNFRVLYYCYLSTNSLVFNRKLNIEGRFQSFSTATFMKKMGEMLCVMEYFFTMSTSCSFLLPRYFRYYKQPLTNYKPYCVNVGFILVLILFIYFVQQYEPSNIIYLPAFVHLIKLLLKGKEQIKTVNLKPLIAMSSIRHAW